MSSPETPNRISLEDEWFARSKLTVWAFCDFWISDALGTLLAALQSFFRSEELVRAEDWINLESVNSLS